jgi:hypothetical protein
VVRLRGFVSAEEAEAVYAECKLGQGGAYQRNQILENEASHVHLAYALVHYL